jgi:hypothetical protein
MRIKRNYITPLLAAAAAAIAIAAAPTAAAANQVCNGSGSGVICQSPGNVQINNAPPPVSSYYPYGNMPYLLGGDGGFGGGGHSGGFGGGGHSGGGGGGGGGGHH